MASERKYDLVLFGATGFTGKLAALYVTKQYGSSIHWAISGRSQDKLARIKAECQDIPDIVLADSGDAASLETMVHKTKVVVTFAGPYCRYGTKLVAACASAGVDYCDITGEVEWVKEMVAKYDDQAKASGARIVSLCGCDSVPWDLTTMMLAKKLSEGGTGELSRVDFWDDMESSFSGGTLESAGEIITKKEKAPEVKELGFDPFLKLREGGQSSFKVVNQNVTFMELANAAIGHSAVRIAWIMAGINVNAVKRSNALNGYGSRVIYREGLAFNSIVPATFTVLGLGIFGAAFFIPPLRWLLRKFVLPKPGEGPSEATMNNGYLNLTGVATSTDGRTAKAILRFPADPGYKDTARMAVEAGLTLSLESSEKLRNSAGGVVTPAACQGEALLQRLVQTGCSFDFAS